MSERLSIAQRSEDGTVWLILAGELDLASAGLLEATVDEVVAAQWPRLLAIDLRELEFMDSTGLRALVLVHRRCVEDGFDLVLVSAAGTVRRVLQVSGIDEHIHVVGAPDDVTPPA